MSAKHSIGWFEIHVNDIEKSKDFYGNLFGWKYKLMKGTKSDYWMINTGDNSLGGGFMKKTEPFHHGASFVIYVETEDIEETLNKAVELGGKIETPRTLITLTSGYFGTFRDIDDNLIGLWSKN